MKLRAAVSVLAAAALSALVAACTQTAGGAGHTPAESSAAAPAVSSAAAPAVSSAAAPVPAGFRPASASFLSPAWGAVLGGVGCTGGRACAARLAVTADGGAHWHWLNSPRAWLPEPKAPSHGPVVSQVVFASQRNGWLYNPYGSRWLWATHDGGAHWRRLALPGNISTIAAAAGTAYAMVPVSPGGLDRQLLLRSPAGKDDWVRAGGMTGSTLAVSGTAAWFGAGAYLWATADGTHWHRYPFHCGGPSWYGLTGIAAASTSDVLFVCTGNGAAGSIGKEVMRSVNGGRTEQLAGQAPFAGSGTVVIVVPPQRSQVILLAATYSLYRSADGGKTWRTAYRNAGITWGSLSCVSGTVGWAVTGVTFVPSQNRLLRTVDSGRTWHPVSF